MFASGANTLYPTLSVDEAISATRRDFVIFIQRDTRLGRSLDNVLNW